ncbi:MULTISPECIES: hypothetical protein [Thermomonosporaceae]|uniref:hypothetical protein n=1 Tax=Thermomonosporaceae TaxID=2012 RepID=UPI00255B3AD3|nr:MULTISPECIES: hypothetical protein [Thermomonosporaceae]MDL4773392.1 hypothetical protein [Actinomadura xylanilytica]
MLRTVLLTGFAVTAAGFTANGPASADTTSPGGRTSAADAAGSSARLYKAPLRAGSRRMSRSLLMEQRFAEWSLRSNGIRWQSSGGCSDRERESCTSFDKIRWGSVDGLIDFKKDSGCPLVITGGTERGHAPGRYSHGTGYKIDIVPTACTDARIHRFRHLGTRGDGAELHRSPADAVFARESDHWDITFR